MQIKDIHKDAEWFASYMNAPDGGNDEQGQALVKCQIKKIRQLTGLIEAIRCELELADEPKDCSERMVLESIRSMIANPDQVQHIVGSYKWIG